MNAAAYRSMIVVYRNGNPVRLDEVARGYDGIENDKAIVWFTRGGPPFKRTLFLNILKQPNTNVVAIADEVKALLQSLRGQLPPTLDLEIRADRSATIRASVADVKF